MSIDEREARRFRQIARHILKRARGVDVVDPVLEQKLADQIDLYDAEVRARHAKMLDDLAAHCDDGVSNEALRHIAHVFRKYHLDEQGRPVLDEDEPRRGA